MFGARSVIARSKQKYRKVKYVAVSLNFVFDDREARDEKALKVQIEKNVPVPLRGEGCATLCNRPNELRTQLERISPHW